MSWEMVKIPDVLFFMEGPGVRNTQFTTKGVKLLNVGNINDGLLNLDSTTKFISEAEAYGKYKHFLVEEGDLLIASSGIVVDNFHNKITWAKAEDLPLCMNTSTIRFKTLDSNILDISFFSYFLKTKLFTDQLRKLITGSAQLNFGPSHLKQISLPLPPIPIQKRIAEILDAADALKRKDQELLKKYDELAQAIFIDMFGDPVRNEKGWEVKKLGDVVLETLTINRNYPHYSIEYIDISAIDNITKKLISTNYFDLDYAPSRAKQIVQYNDILISTVRPNLNCVTIVDLKIDNLICSTGFCVLRTKSKLINESFLFEIVKFKSFIDELVKVSKGASYPAVSDSDILNISISVPPISLQNKYSNALNLINTQSMALKNGECSSDLFNALIQKAFKGELN